MLATAFAAPTELTQATVGGASTTSRRPAARQTNGLTDGLAAGPARTIDAREHLFCEGDRATHVYLVEAGHVCISRLLPDGRRQVIDFAYPGDIIGLGALDTHATSAQATTKTRLRCIPIAALHDVAARNAGLGRKLYEALSHELLAAREHLFTVSQCTAAERVAAFLLALSRRNARRGENPTEIVLPMTRNDIADFLGLTIETISRTFSKFRADGLIELEHCILVTLLDADGLADVARGAGASVPSRNYRPTCRGLSR